MFLTIFKCNITQRYERVEPYIYDLQSKCIALCNISLFFIFNYIKYKVYTLNNMDVSKHNFKVNYDIDKNRFIVINRVNIYYYFTF